MTDSSVRNIAQTGTPGEGLSALARLLGHVMGMTVTLSVAPMPGHANHRPDLALCPSAASDPSPTTSDGMRMSWRVPLLGGTWQAVLQLPPRDMDGSAIDQSRIGAMSDLVRPILEDLAARMQFQAEAESIGQAFVRLKRESRIDQLTGLLRRESFAEDVRDRLSDSRRGTIVVIDLNDFKRVNDTLGHAEGDRIIARVGAILTTCLRAYDVAARFGGDEFALFLPGLVQQSKVSSVLDRLQMHMLDDAEISSHDISFSWGTSVLVAAHDLNKALQAADLEMIRQKAERHRRATFMHQVHR
ncbi:GGDEF domain-containing protein [Phaeobacter italicus]|uniref:GGDEF domain-containing protein n=1 Tax=Phaeobacter italicus TaxID=481446 RepID=UPI002433293C|nr:GGDEF domain-containing protein [Phaeobacter italicus]MCI5101168.1 GGDEF domain-containing protein [Phaeobacter italicus]